MENKSMENIDKLVQENQKRVSERLQDLTEEEALVIPLTEQDRKDFMPFFSPWDGCCDECKAHICNQVADNHHMSCSSYKPALISWILQRRVMDNTIEQIKSWKEKWLEKQKDRRQGYWS